MKSHSPSATLALLAASMLSASASIPTSYLQDFTFDDGTTDLGDGSVISSNNGTNQVLNNALRITDNAITSTASSFRIPALPDSCVGWKMTFDYTLSCTGTPADGFSINYGAIPATGEGAAEEGWDGGIDHISFEIDTWMNVDTEQGVNVAVNQVDLAGGFVNGVVLPNDGSTSGTVTITFDPYQTSFTTSGLTTNAAFANLVHGFQPNSSYSWAISARTGGATETLIIDNLSITTGVQSDSDGDGLSDGFELLHGFDHLTNNDAAGDPDMDGLTNLQEQACCTDPNDNDTDDDGLLDAVETKSGFFTDSTNTGTNPLNPDTDGDGLLDGVETGDGNFVDSNATGTNPNLADSDNDGLDDPTESVLAPSGRRDPSVADPPTPSTTYKENFDGLPDGSTQLGDGSAFAGTAQIVGDKLQLTTNTNGNVAAFHIPALLNTSTGYSATFDFTISDLGSPGTPPADGWSFSSGTIPPGTLSAQAEEGWPGIGNVLAFEFDTWMNGDAEVGPAVSVNNVTVPGGFVNGDILADESTANGTATILVTSGGFVSFTMSGDAGLLNPANFPALATAFIPADADTFAFAARTGGANELVTIDNLCIQTGVADTDGDGLPDVWEILNGLSPTDDGTGDPVNGPAGNPDGDTLDNAAEFANGTNPQSDDTDNDGLLDGAELAGAGSRPPTSPVLADTDGDGLSDLVETNDGSFNDANDTGTNPILANTDGDSCDDAAEVALLPLVGRDPLVSDDPPAGTLYCQDFDAFPDGFTKLGDNSTIVGTDGSPTTAVRSGQLWLTDDAVSGTRASYRLPAMLSSSMGWCAKFDLTIIDGPGEGVPADGFAFGYGAIPDFNPAFANSADPDAHGLAEAGWGPVDHISYEVHTWQNGQPSVGVGIASNVGGAQNGHAFTNGNILEDDSTVSGPVTMTWTPGGGASFTTGGLLTNANFSNLPIPGFVGNDAHRFGFTSRTGGSDATVIIDNMKVLTGLPGSDEWEIFHFGSVGGPGSGPNEDLDNDTLETITELAYGLDPTVADNNELTVTDGSSYTRGTPVTNVETTAGAPNFTVRYIRRTDGLIATTVRFSHDLSDFENSTASPVVVSDDGSGYQVVEVPYPFILSNGRKPRFFVIENALNP